MDDDLYELLEVSPRASGEVIQAAYRRLARTYHPDGESPDPEKMVRLNLAFEVLGDDQKRSVYDADRGQAPEPTSAPVVPSWRTAYPLPPFEAIDEPPPVRRRTALWMLVAVTFVVVLGGVLAGSLLQGRDNGGSAAPDATPEPRTATDAADLKAPAGVSPSPTPVSTAMAPRLVDLGPIASEIPGTPLVVGSSVKSVVDQNTKPRDVYAITLTAGQEIRFVLTDLSSPITAWVDTSVINPGARDLSDSRSFTLALTRSTRARDEWRFTPAVAGTYYLVVRAQTSAQAYAFTLAATR
ncbi:MAG: J domain-containing protein [Dehalococcoidia bacterium]|nr:MAG: J domain-containing protein [Dehalococcoidia bacterium]